jgi:transposase
VLSLRWQLTKRLAIVKNQAHGIADPMPLRMSQRHIRGLKADIALLERRLAAIVAADPGLARRYRLLRSVPGVGPVLAQTLRAWLSELGRIGRKQIAALAGEPRRVRRRLGSLSQAAIAAGSSSA